MSQLEVKILHQDYLLTCPDGQESQLLEAAERVDSQLEHMRESGKIRSRERLGVLLAINLAYENLELRAQLKALQEQLVGGDWQESQSAATEDELIALASLQSQQIRDTEIASALIAKIDAALITPSQQAENSSSPENWDSKQESEPLSINSEDALESPMLSEMSEMSEMSDQSMDYSSEDAAEHIYTDNSEPIQDVSLSDSL